MSTYVLLLNKIKIPTSQATLLVVQLLQFVLKARTMDEREFSMFLFCCLFLFVFGSIGLHTHLLLVTGKKIKAKVVLVIDYCYTRDRVHWSLWHGSCNAIFFRKGGIDADMFFLTVFKIGKVCISFAFIIKSRSSVRHCGMNLNNTFRNLRTERIFLIGGMNLFMGPCFFLLLLSSCFLSLSRRPNSLPLQE